MRLSNLADYAVVTMSAAARHCGGARVSAGQLAQETGLPIHVDEDPLTCVVRGTGRILDDYEKYRSVLSA